MIYARWIFCYNEKQCEGNAEEFIIRIPNYDFATVEACVGEKIQERRD